MQKSWATVHNEAYTVTAALKKFRNWTFICKIHVYSDHNAITFLTELAPKKLMRWSTAMQQFDIHFHYIRGKITWYPMV